MEEASERDCSLGDSAFAVELAGVTSFSVELAREARHGVVESVHLALATFRACGSLVSICAALACDEPSLRASYGRLGHVLRGTATVSASGSPPGQILLSARVQCVLDRVHFAGHHHHHHQHRQQGTAKAEGLAGPPIPPQLVRELLAGLAQDPSVSHALQPVVPKFGWASSSSLRPYRPNPPPSASLARFGVNLVAQALAQGPHHSPVTDRWDEARKLVLVLERQRANHVVLIGDRGVGKTSVVRRAAQRMACTGGWGEVWCVNFVSALADPDGFEGAVGELARATVAAHPANKVVLLFRHIGDLTQHAMPTPRRDRHRQLPIVVGAQLLPPVPPLELGQRGVDAAGAGAGGRHHQPPHPHHHHPHHFHPHHHHPHHQQPATASPQARLSRTLQRMLASPAVRVVATATLGDYRRCIENHPLGRRLQQLHVREPSAQTTLAMLRSHRLHLHATGPVRVSDRALQAVVRLADEHLRSRTSRPARSFALLHRACERKRLGADAPGAAEDRDAKRRRVEPPGNGEGGEGDEPMAQPADEDERAVPGTVLVDERDVDLALRELLAGGT